MLPLSKYILAIALIAPSITGAQAQNSARAGGDSKKSFHHFYLGLSVKGAESVYSRKAGFMAGYETGWKAGESVSINMDLNYKSWSDRDFRIFQLHTGVSYMLNPQSSFRFEPGISLGPALNIGNDYAGFFASWAFYMKFHYSKQRKSGVFGFARLNQNAVFHSTDQQFLYEFGLGYRLN